MYVLKVLDVYSLLEDGYFLDGCSVVYSNGLRIDCHGTINYPTETNKDPYNSFYSVLHKTIRLVGEEFTDFVEYSDKEIFNHIIEKIKKSYEDNGVSNLALHVHLVHIVLYDNTVQAVIVYHPSFQRCNMTESKHYRLLYDEAMQKITAYENLLMKGFNSLTLERQSEITFEINNKINLDIEKDDILY